MVYGKAIELFLVNGTAESLVTAELSNWNGKAIKIPRTEVNSCDRDDIKGVVNYYQRCLLRLWTYCNFQNFMLYQQLLKTVLWNALS